MGGHERPYGLVPKNLGQKGRGFLWPVSHSPRLWWVGV